LRISIVIATLGGGGAERTAVELARRWSATGNSVTLNTFAPDDDDVYPASPGVTRTVLSDHSPSAGRRSLLARLATPVVLRRALRDQRPDVAVSFLNRTNIRLAMATLGTGIPTILCESNDPRHFPLGAIWRLLRRLTYPFADALVVHSESLRAWCGRVMLRRERVHVVPNAVWIDVVTPARAPGKQSGTRTLLALGRLEHVKGFDLLLRAFALVAPDTPDWRLVIHGEGSERTSLEALRSSLGLTDRVALPGFTAEPSTALAEAEVFVLSSRTEGSPLALVEAMASGLAVVSFDCPSGPADVITDGINGLLVPPEDVEALAAALRTLMRHGGLRKRLGAAATQVLATVGPSPVMSAWDRVLTDAGAGTTH